MSQLFTSGGQSIGVSASASVLPVNILDWFPLGWTDAEAEAEAPILWLLDVKSQLIGKDSDDGKDWMQKGGAVAEDEIVR